MSDKLKNTWKQIKSGFKDENIISKITNNVGSGMNKSASTGFGIYLDVSKKGLKIKKQEKPKNFKGY
tara:strand:- start:3061 stop:3261 length:201 start_codon:yes stop_codon:yes gene_type:complete